MKGSEGRIIWLIINPKKLSFPLNVDGCRQQSRVLVANLILRHDTVDNEVVLPSEVSVFQVIPASVERRTVPPSPAANARVLYDQMKTR